MKQEIYEKMISINSVLSRLRHDLDNMLNGVTGYAEVIALRTEGQKEIERDCGRIREICGEISSMVHGVTKYSGVSDEKNLPGGCSFGHIRMC